MIDNIFLKAATRGSEGFYEKFNFKYTGIIDDKMREYKYSINGEPERNYGGNRNNRNNKNNKNKKKTQKKKTQKKKTQKKKTQKKKPNKKTNKYSKKRKNYKGKQ